MDFFFLMRLHRAGSAISANIKYLKPINFKSSNPRVFVVMKLMIQNMKNMADMKWPSTEKT